MPSLSSADLHRYEIEIEWSYELMLPVLAAPMSYPVYQAGTEHNKCTLSVFTEADRESLKQKITILTVHDVGANHKSFVEFAQFLRKEVPELADQIAFVHVCLPGQESGAKDFVARYNVETVTPAEHYNQTEMEAGGEFPSMEQLGKAMGQVLDKLGIGGTNCHCFGIGEGAGADILCRFALEFPEKIQGLVLVNPSSTAHGIVASIKELFASLPLECGEMTNSNWNYLLVHKFGNHHRDAHQLRYIQAIIDEGINANNLSRFLYNFSKRTDFTGELKNKLKSTDVILVTGGKAPHNENVLHMFEHLNPDRRGLIEADGMEDVLAEAPDHVVYALMTVFQRNKLFLDIPKFSQKRAAKEQQ